MAGLPAPEDVADLESTRCARLGWSKAPPRAADLIGKSGAFEGSKWKFGSAHEDEAAGVNIGLKAEGVSGNVWCRVPLLLPIPKSAESGATVMSNVSMSWDERMIGSGVLPDRFLLNMPRGTGSLLGLSMVKKGGREGIVMFVLRSAYGTEAEPMAVWGNNRSKLVEGDSGV
jgi:hypothetical protein